MLEIILNRSEIAETFGVSLPTIDGWVRKGCPCKKGGRGKPYIFNLQEVIKWREENIADKNEDIDLKEARRRKAVAIAKLKELELKVAQGSYVHIDEVGKFLERVFTAFRQRILAIPTKAAPLVYGAKNLNQVHDILKKQLYEALNELSEFEPEE